MCICMLLYPPNFPQYDAMFYFDTMKSSVLVTEQPRNLGNQSDDQRRATVRSLDVNYKKKERIAAFDEAPLSPIL